MEQFQKNDGLTKREIIFLNIIFYTSIAWVAFLVFAGIAIM